MSSSRQHATRNKPSYKPGSRPQRRFPILPVVGGAVVLAAAIAIGISVAGSGGAGGDDRAQVREVRVVGEALPDDAAAEVTGLPAPELLGQDFDGNPVLVEDDGRPKILLFLAHWCPHCQAEVPVVVDWLEDGAKPEGVDLYAVSTAVSRDRPNYPPSAWLEEEGLDVPTIVDDAEGSAARAYGLTGFPYFVAVDAEGNVLARRSGELGRAELDALAGAVADA